MFNHRLYGVTDLRDAAEHRQSTSDKARVHSDLRVSMSPLLLSCILCCCLLYWWSCAEYYRIQEFRCLQRTCGTVPHCLADRNVAHYLRRIYDIYDTPALFFSAIMHTPLVSWFMRQSPATED